MTSLYRLEIWSRLNPHHFYSCQHHHFHHLGRRYFPYSLLPFFRKMVPKCLLKETKLPWVFFFFFLTVIYSTVVALREVKVTKFLKHWAQPGQWQGRFPSLSQGKPGSSVRESQNSRAGRDLTAHSATTSATGGDTSSQLRLPREPGWMGPSTPSSLSSNARASLLSE